jgi:hypothetical protein
MVFSNSSIKATQGYNAVYDSTIYGGLIPSFSNINGGYNNVIHGSEKSVIGGGDSNDIYESISSFIGGGNLNTISGYNNVIIVGGSNNCNTGQYASIVGGCSNSIINNSEASFIGGGYRNTIDSGEGGYPDYDEIYNDESFSFIGAGSDNYIWGIHSAILAGRQNSLSGSNSFILGSNISTDVNNMTFVNNLSSEGMLRGTLLYSPSAHFDESLIENNLTIYGNLSVLGTRYDINTSTVNTSSLYIVNPGVGPAIYAQQVNGIYDIANFVSEYGISVLYVKNAPFEGIGKVGINTNTPNSELTVVGDISATGYLYGKFNGIFDNLNIIGLTANNAIIQNLTANNFLADGINIGSTTITSTIKSSAFEGFDGNSINIYNGGFGGCLTFNGGNASFFGDSSSGYNGGNAGCINLNGGSASSSDNAGNGGCIIMTGSYTCGNAGSIDTSGYENADGGCIQTCGGINGTGGSIDTSNGGGSIITNGTGCIGLGTSSGYYKTQTMLCGTATHNRTICFPDDDGTIALRETNPYITSTIYYGASGYITDSEIFVSNGGYISINGGNGSNGKSGGLGGIICLNGGCSDAATGGNAGSIIINGGNWSEDTSSGSYVAGGDGGSINLSGGVSNISNQYIQTNGGNGGSISMIGGACGHGGSISMNGNLCSNAGSITLNAGGCYIDVNNYANQDDFTPAYVPGGNAGYINLNGGTGSGYRCSDIGSACLNGGYGGHINLYGGSGSNGGTIDMNGGSGAFNGPFVNAGGGGGSISLNGASANINPSGSWYSGSGGSISMNGTAWSDDDGGNGGSITMNGGHGGSSNGGSIIANGDCYASGGTLNMSAGKDASGGSIDTSNGGGSIITNGTGCIGLGTSSGYYQTQTMLCGTATSNRTICFPDNSGTVALLSDIKTINVIDKNSDYTLTSDDNGNIIHFDTSSSSLTALIPNSLGEGFNASFLNVGTHTLYLSSDIPLTSLGNSIFGKGSGMAAYIHNSNLYAIGKF